MQSATAARSALHYSHDSIQAAIRIGFVIDTARIIAPFVVDKKTVGVATARQLNCDLPITVFRASKIKGLFFPICKIGYEFDAVGSRGLELEDHRPAWCSIL